jgi:hypothetical protein
MSSIGLWHVANGRQPVRLAPQELPAERDLENWVEADPSIISPSLHAVRRQVPLGGKFLDLLAVEAPGTWVICELKKMKLEREVLAQALDYMARIEELSLPDFRKLVTEKIEDLPIRSRELIHQALSREENGEGRDLRIVLTGIGVKEELTRMVNSLSGRYGVPIQVCTLSAMRAPEGDGFILLRDTSDDLDVDDVAAAQGTTYELRIASVRSAFEGVGAGTWFDKILQLVGENENLWAKPWKKALTIAPATHHGRFLFYFTPRDKGIFAMLSVDAVEEFFPDADIQTLEALPSEILFTSPEAISNWIASISASIGRTDSAPKAAPAQWNGKDWYVSFGEFDGGHVWEDAAEFGFVSAGGGDWYSNTLRKLPVGARIFVYIPRLGYIAQGFTTGEAEPFHEAKFLQGKSLRGTYTYENGELEYAVPVTWSKVLPRDKAISELGLFANQNSACKLRDPKTLGRLYDVFGLSD